MLPEKAGAKLKEHLDGVKKIHARDFANGFGRGIDVCLPISGLPGKDTQTHARRDHSNTQLRAPGQTYQIPCASRAPSLARDHFQPDCKRDSIPI